MPQPNDQLGPYILIQKLGSGQFGVVWKAQRRYGIAPPCAIKLPTDHEVKWEDVEKEARVWLHASGHPNVLPMIEANVYDEQIALVSEYAADGSLLDWLRKHGGKAPSVEKAVEIMSSILAGLEHLHRRNIIHRDLKPANILLQGDIPRLADFGLSRVLSSTQSTTPAGTLAYMSPEAFNGERNAQTDIWAAGVILYQLLTGRLPFPQRDMASLMNAIFMKLPEPLPPDLPEPLRSTVMRALEKTCERRYESAAVMRESLLRINATSQPLPVSPVKPITPQSAQYIAPRDVEYTPPVTPIVHKLKADAPDQSVASPKNNKPDQSATWADRVVDGKKRLLKRTEKLIIVGVILFIGFTGIYLYKNLSQGNSELQQPGTSVVSSFTEDLGKGVKLEMIRVPGGTFQMGSNDGQENERPAHQVTVSPFAIGKYEVVQAQWQAVMGNNPSNLKGDDLPVENISWEDVQEFCRKLSQQTGQKYRLPTEAEWEYACRAGSTGDYAGNLDAMAWYGSKSGNKMHPVGQKQPNAWGLYDMHGNVQEWCQDWYDGSYYSQSPAMNPQGPSTGSIRVTRGGSWGYAENYFRSASRTFAMPSYRNYDLGFRLVRKVK